MTFLGYERPVEYRRQQIFDPTTANMVLNAQQNYINEVKNEYLRGLADLKEFNREYGDFVTPIFADQDWYNKNFTGKIRDFINNAYDNGVDLLRSPEGRMAMTVMMNNLPYGEYAKKKTRAENAKEWYKNMGILRSKGKYDEDFSNFLKENPNQWALDDPGTTSPTEYQTLKEATNDWYNNRTPRTATAEEMKRMGLDPRYNWSLYSDNDLMNVARDNTPGWRGSAVANYNRYLAEQQVAASGLPYTQQDVENQLQRNIASAQQEWLVGPIKGNADAFMLQAQKAADDRALEGIKYNNQVRLQQARSSGSGSGTSSEKESLSDAQYQLMRGTANIIANTSFGRAAGITNYTDFDPDRFDILLTGAQKEIANKYYTKDISGGGDATVQKVGETPSFVWDDNKGKFVHNNDTGINLGNYSVSSTSFLPALNRKQRVNLHDANLKFIDAMSVDYTPAKFAKWLNRPTASNDSNMSSISNDDDAINRLYSLDEVSLRSSGVDRPSEDLKWASNNTDASRKILEKNKNNLYIKGAGKAFTHVKNDGSVHMYQIVNVYSSKGTASKQSFNQMEKVGKMAFDMGITTYDNPNHGIGGNMSTNLYFDENKDADIRWSGDQSVLHWEHVGSPKIDATIAYPQLPSTTLDPQLPLYKWGQQ